MFNRCRQTKISADFVQIYANRSRSETRSYQQLPSPEPSISSAPIIGIQKVAEVQQTTTVIPDIAPMRRGRPTAPSQQTHLSAKGTPAGSRGTSTDPFTALDSNDLKVRPAAVDELSSKYPSLDEFSLLHDRGAKFEFGQSAPADGKQEALQKRVTEALADEAFGQPVQTRKESAPTEKPSSTLARTASPKRPQSIEPAKQQPPSRSQPALIHQPSPKRPVMVSTGVGASPPSSPHLALSQGRLDRPIWRVPQTKAPNIPLPALDQPLRREPSPELPPRPEPSSKSGLLQRNRIKSQNLSMPTSKSPSSSRPSLEGSRPSVLDLNDPISRSKSANSRPRPASVFTESGFDHTQDPDNPHEGGRRSAGLQPRSAVVDDSSDEEGPLNLSSNLEFLQSLEGGDSGKRRGSSGAKKRSSLQGVVSGTKNLLGGRFGDAFRRFEGNSGGSQLDSHRSHSVGPEHELLRGHTLTPIAGSEATGTSGRSDDEAIDETEDLSPEVRRELERRRLSQEEKRVASAAAEYRQRLQAGDRAAVTSVGKSSTIQNRIQSLQDDGNKPPPPKTAEGYGRFTDPQKAAGGERPLIARKPVKPAALTMASPSAAAQPAQRTGPKPMIAPKPVALRTGGGGTHDGIVQRNRQDEDDLETAFARKFPGLTDLEMVDMEIPSSGAGASGRQQHTPNAAMGTRIKDV